MIHFKTRIFEQKEIKLSTTLGVNLEYSFNENPALQMSQIVLQIAVF